MGLVSEIEYFVSCILYLYCVCYEVTMQNYFFAFLHDFHKNSNQMCVLRMQ